MMDIIMLVQTNIFMTNSLLIMAKLFSYVIYQEINM